MAVGLTRVEVSAQHVHAAIGVSTRGAAALVAAEHGLLTATRPDA